MLIERPQYLNKLISGMGRNQVKIVTGVRRCGKSFLLFTLFKKHLLEQGVPQENIVEMAFDRYSNKKYRNPEAFLSFANESLGRAHGKRYVLLDEVQLLDDFAEVLNDLISIDDIDVYVTGSNAHLLSKDVVTEFRGRGWEISMAPLSFSEFMSAYDGDKRDGYTEYANYGGLPEVLSMETPEEKAEYLISLYKELYVRDIVERNGVRYTGNLEDLIDVLSSAIGSLTNPMKLSATFKSEKHVVIAPETIDRYISFLEDSFLISRAKRYDIKGRRYIGTPFKFYFTDLGLRNARMNFRQVEQSHIMENIIYNELLQRGFGVDVGVVSSVVKGEDGKRQRSAFEIDFVCNKGSKRYYIQSAFDIPTLEKKEQEQRPLLKVDDGFKKIVITKDGFAPYYNENGVLIMNVYDFLLDGRSLDY